MIDDTTVEIRIDDQNPIEIKYLTVSDYITGTSNTIFVKETGITPTIYTQLSDEDYKAPE